MTIKEASERLGRIEADAEERKDDFTIVFCGVFSSGKSSVLNYLLDSKDFSLPVGNFPITKLITRIRYGDSLRFLYKECADGAERYIDQERFQRLVVGKEAVPDGCTEIVVEFPSPFLKNRIVFVDTPGFLDEMGGDLERISREAVLNGDLAIFCTSAASLGHQFEREYIEELEESIGNYCMIVNHMDCCNTPEDQDDIHKRAAFLMKGKGGQALNDLFGRTCFFTIASGAAKTLDKFDSYLAYALQDMKLRRKIKTVSYEKTTSFKKRCLAMDIEAELERLREKAEEVQGRHVKLQTKLDAQRRQAELDNKMERDRLLALYRAEIEQMTERLAAKIRHMGNPKTFVGDVKSTVRTAYMDIADKVDAIAGLEGDRRLRKKFASVCSNLAIPEPKRIVTRRLGFLERAGKTLYNVYLFESIDPDLVLEDGCEYGYADYHTPAIQVVRNELEPKLREKLQAGLEHYEKEKPVSAGTGLEQELVDLGTSILVWESLLRKCAIQGPENGGR